MKMHLSLDAIGCNQPVSFIRTQPPHK